jgi:hypothetical protein
VIIVDARSLARIVELVKTQSPPLKVKRRLFDVEWTLF